VVVAEAFVDLGVGQVSGKVLSTVVNCLVH